MAKTTKFRVREIRPNPCRDLTRFPIREEVVERLLRSFDRTGIWGEGRLIVRLNPQGEPEACFGHHMLEALKRRLGPEGEVTVTVEEVSDPDMLRRMIEENDARRSRDGLQNMEDVHAVVQAFAQGTIELDPPPPTTPRKRTRFAPSFVQGGDVADQAPQDRSLDYTAKTVAAYLNWNEKRVQEALMGLEAVEMGLVAQEAFAGIAGKDIREIVLSARARLEGQLKQDELEDESKTATPFLPLILDTEDDQEMSGLNSQRRGRWSLFDLHSQARGLVEVYGPKARLILTWLEARWQRLALEVEA